MIIFYIYSLCFSTSVPKPDTDVSSSQENGDLNEEEVDTSSDEVKKKRHPDGIAEMLSQVGTRFHPSLLFPPSLLTISGSLCV